MVRRALPALLVVAVLTAAPAGASAACADADLEPTAATAGRAATAVRCLADVERRARGLPVHSGDVRLDLAAAGHALDMLRRRYFAHDTPEGVDPGERIGAAGYDASAWAENIAVGQRTPAEVMVGWMRSPGHCRAVLSTTVTQLGVAVVVPSGDEERIHWAQAFGRPAGDDSLGPDFDVDSACPAAGLADPAAAGLVAALPVAAERRTPPVATPRARVRLRVALRLVGKRARIAGKVLSGDVRRVRIVVRRGARTRRVTVGVQRSGAFRVVLLAPRGSGRVRVTARSL